MGTETSKWNQVVSCDTELHFLPGVRKGAKERESSPFPCPTPHRRVSVPLLMDASLPQPRVTG